MSRRKDSRTVDIEETQLHALRRLSESTRVPVSVYIREGIDLALQKHAEPTGYQLALEQKLKNMVESLVSIYGADPDMLDALMRGENDS